jgi:predicted permease
MLWLLLAIIYVGGGWRFWSGFRQTNFSQNRLVLTLLWPALLVNKSYRQNFRKALKG